MINKEYGKSVKDRLLNLSRKEGIDYQQLVIRYFHERLVYRLSKSSYKEHFLLKGGVLLYVYNKLNSRPTVDIDFLGYDINNDLEEITDAFKQICKISCEEDGVVFDSTGISARSIMEGNQYHGVRIRIMAFLDTIAQPISIDVGFGDIVVPKPVHVEIPLILNNMPVTKMAVYPLESVLSEKFHSIIVLGEDNSRMKDFFDIYYLLKNKQIDMNILKKALLATFEHRGLPKRNDFSLFSDTFSSNPTLNIRWNIFVKRIKWKSVLSFDEVVAHIQNEIKPIVHEYVKIK